jgi:hypothetical protein
MSPHIKDFLASGLLAMVIFLALLAGLMLGASFGSDTTYRRGFADGQVKELKAQQESKDKS